MAPNTQAKPWSGRGQNSSARRGRSSSSEAPGRVVQDPFKLFTAFFPAVWAVSQSNKAVMRPEQSITYFQAITKTKSFGERPQNAIPTASCRRRKRIPEKPLERSAASQRRECFAAGRRPEVLNIAKTFKRNHECLALTTGQF
jgi:hypothetical protein